jgi:hypothetical protein
VRRTLLSCAVLAVFVLPCRADETAATPETLVRLTVQPAAAPKPALRYQLLPQLKEMNPGNPIQNYMKCFMDQQKFFFDKEAFERREKLLTMPLKELPARELQEYGGFALSQADWAARLDNPDWQILLNMKADGIYTSIPDMRQLRPLASALKVRFRGEVALGRFDDALRTAKTMFAMSRHLGEHPTFVGNLYGFAIANLAIGPLEEMLEQPNCPNLYWALTNLPNPLVSLETASQGERVGIIQWLFRDLDDSAPMSADRLTKFIAFMEKLVKREMPKKLSKSVRTWLDARINDKGMVRAARQHLVEFGLSEAQVRLFPAEQVILLDEKRELEVRFDDVMKTINLPLWHAEVVGDRYKRAKEPLGPLAPVLIADEFVPAVDEVVRARARLGQRIALLRHVEALRLYAAEHNGTLPAKLSDVAVPLPDDPFTGKPFRYEVTGNTAHLRGTRPQGEEKNLPFNIHYEVTLQK